MSERKTAEIKFRCTPTFKAGLQAAAEAEGISASQFIENAVQNVIWAKQNDRVVPAPFTGTPILVEDLVAADAEPSPGLLEFISTNVAAEPVVLTPELLEKAHASGVGCCCRPWEFCPHKAS